MKNMRIGIFGGSFDPVHLEHVRLAKAAAESLSLDRLFIVPACVPPHKKGKTLSSEADRLEMCRIAFADIPVATVSDYEISRGGTSYTLLTCRHFRSLYPAAELFFLVGTDMLRDFPRWRKPEEILSLATLAVCAREENEDWEEREQRDFFSRFGRRFAVIGYRGGAVSSTDVRVLAGAGEDVSQFVGDEVAAYIARKGLYAIPGAKEALALEKPSRHAHSIRVATTAVKKAPSLKIDEKKALTAALFHDCAKNLPPDSPLLKGFLPPEGVPDPVLHQYAGAYVAENTFGVTDGDVLDAIRYHTSGRENMSLLEKLIFLSDMLEPGRDFEGVEQLRNVFQRDKENLEECMKMALSHMLAYLEAEGGKIYPLTKRAYEFLLRQKK